MNLGRLRNVGSRFVPSVINEPFTRTAAGNYMLRLRAHDGGPIDALLITYLYVPPFYNLSMSFWLHSPDQGGSTPLFRLTGEEHPTTTLPHPVLVPLGGGIRELYVTGDDDFSNWDADQLQFLLLREDAQ